MDTDFLNDLSFKIRGAAFKVHNAFGPGLLESVYEQAIVAELRSLELSVESQVAVPVQYEDGRLAIGFRLDILVENAIIIEIKSVERLNEVHFKQLQTYLKLADKKLGLLINFNSAKLVNKESIIRIVNNF